MEEKESKSAINESQIGIVQHTHTHLHTMFTSSHNSVQLENSSSRSRRGEENSGSRSGTTNQRMINGQESEDQSKRGQRKRQLPVPLGGDDARQFSLV